MAKFVNFKKRSFTLPQGCRDLIDVLEPSRRVSKGTVASASFQPPQVKEDRFPAAGLAQIGRYISMLLQSRGEFFTLSLEAREMEFPVTLYRSKGEQTVMIVLVIKEAHQEQAIRTFFGLQGLEPIFDQADTDAADATRGLGYQLPPDIARATWLTTELLRGTYGLSDEAGLDFRYYEMETAAS